MFWHSVLGELTQITTRSTPVLLKYRVPPKVRGHCLVLCDRWGCGSPELACGAGGVPSVFLGGEGGTKIPLVLCFNFGRILTLAPCPPIIRIPTTQARNRAGGMGLLSVTEEQGDFPDKRIRRSYE